jgi:hypothetical protein
MSFYDEEADVLSSPGAITLWAGVGTNGVNISPTDHNLDGLGSITVYGAGTMTGAGGEPLGNTVGNTTLNVYDQANPHPGAGATSYNVGYGVTRTAHGLLNGRLRTWQTQILAYHLTGLSLYTGPTPNIVNLGAAEWPTAIYSGAADTITVGDVLDAISQLTLDAHGGTLALNDDGIANFDNGDSVQVSAVTYGITDRSVAYADNWQAVQVIDPADLNGQHKPVIIRSNGTNRATIDYQNVTDITINGAPVDTTYFVESTAVGVPLTINASTGQRPSTYSFLTHVYGGSTVNQFIVSDANVADAKGTVKSIHSRLTFNGSSALDTVILDDSNATAQDFLTITNGQSGDVEVGQAGDQFFGAGGSMDCSGIGSLTVDLSNAAYDVVHLSPSVTTAFTINGDASEYQAGFGAELDIVLGGTTDDQLVPGLPGAGTWTFANKSHMPITFNNVKSTNPQ